MHSFFSAFSYVRIVTCNSVQRAPISQMTYAILFFFRFHMSIQAIFHPLKNIFLLFRHMKLLFYSNAYVIWTLIMVFSLGFNWIWTVFDICIWSFSLLHMSKQHTDILLTGHWYTPDISESIHYQPVLLPQKLSCLPGIKKAQITVHHKSATRRIRADCGQVQLWSMKPGSFPCCFSNEYVPYCCDNEQEKGNRKKKKQKKHQKIKIWQFVL